MDPTILVQQLTVQAPMMLIYGVSIIFCLVFVRRYPLPAALAIFGLATGLVTAIGYVLIYTYLTQLREEQAWDVPRFAGAVQVLSVVATGGRGLAVALLVAAVFVGRKRTTQPD